jgi:hypothetical protein
MVSPQLQVAVDVGRQRHRIAVRDIEGRLLEEFDVDHTDAGLSGLFARARRLQEAGWAGPTIASDASRLLALKHEIDTLDESIEQIAQSSESAHARVTLGPKLR